VLVSPALPSDFGMGLGQKREAKCRFHQESGTFRCPQEDQVNSEIAREWGSRFQNFVRIEVGWLQIEAVGEVVDDGVAFAGFSFQAFAIEDLDVSALVGDDAGFLESAGGCGDAGAADAEHFGEKLLGEVEVLAFDAVLDHEEPAGEAVLDFVEAVAGGELTQDKAVALDELENAPKDGAGFEELLLQVGVAHTEGGAFDLNERGGGRGHGAKEVDALDHALATDEADLGARSIGHEGDDGGDAGGHEVGVFGLFAGAVEDGAEGKGDGFHAREQGFARSGWQGIEQQIRRAIGHRGCSASVRKEQRLTLAKENCVPD